MHFDFESIMDRHGWDAMAVEALGKGGIAPDLPDEGFDVIPMWVADMNFPTAPSIVEAIQGRLEHLAFGYFDPRDEYFQAIIDWQEKRNGVKGLTPGDIGYENGVLGGVVSAVRAFAAPGDAVLVHSPTYIGFSHCLSDNGYRAVLSPLVRDGDGMWRMDYENMDSLLEKSHAHVAILCSPHNPTGRVWTRDELERAMEVFAAHDCVVISDEIWSDLVMPGIQHVPTQSVSADARRRTIALYAPSKTFNLAGLVGSYHVIYDSYLRDRVTAISGKTCYNSMNVLSMYALIGAYSEVGAAWLDELRGVLDGNLTWACNYISKHFEGVETRKPEGSYMLFLDCTDWCRAHGTDIDWVLHEGWRVGVDWQDGRDFHGPCHVRMNLALPLSRVKEAFERLDRYVFGA
ncbi:MAG: MalY/PatB family protein [Coriobacteriales bacterium]|jgi:cystathionine beta-lyase